MNLNATTNAAAPAKQTKGTVLGYAEGKILSATPSENGEGTNVLVQFPAPVGEVNVYVKAERTLPPIGGTATFMAILDDGALTPHIRLAGRLTTAAVNEVFVNK